MSEVHPEYCDRAMLESMEVSKWTPSRIDSAYGSISVSWARHPDPNKYENAERAAAAIVRACNSHHKLVEALENWLNALDAKRKFERDNPNNVSREWERKLIAVECAEDAARAALSLAKGE